MAILLNGAGATAADPILKGLPLTAVVGASSMDVASITDVGFDTGTAFPITNSVKSSLSPAATVVTQGNAGTYDDTTKQLAISSTTGMANGNYIYLSHASITAGLYAVNVVDGTHLSFPTGANPFNGLGNKTGITYEVAWSYSGTAGTAPLTSSGGGTQLYFKADMADSAGNHAQSNDTFFVRDAPAGSGYVALQGQTYTGASAATATPSLDILAAWANRGGIATVELANHSAQGVNNFSWTSGGGAGEKTLATALSSGLTVSNIAGGTNYGAIRFRSLQGSATYLAVDMDLTVDLTAPTLVFLLTGR